MTTPPLDNTSSDSAPRPSSKFSIYTLLGLPPSSSSQKFDADHKYVTSPVFRNPFVFGGLRLLTGVYTLVTLVVMIAIYEVRFGTGSGFFSFFTHLSYIGLCAYLFASSVQTLSYALRWRRNGAGAGYALQKWPRILQALHVVLYSSIVTYPFVVTIVYWALLSSGSFESRLRSWTNTSVHILNLVFALGEIFLSNSPPIPWITLPMTVLMLGGYVGVAYITRETQGFYPYSFLDPQETGSILAAYIVGIAVGQCIVFVFVHFLIVLRQRWAIKARRVLHDSANWTLDFSTSSSSSRSRSRPRSKAPLAPQAATAATEEASEEGNEDWEEVDRPVASPAKKSTQDSRSSSRGAAGSRERGGSPAREVV